MRRLLAGALIRAVELSIKMEKIFFKVKSIFYKDKCLKNKKVSQIIRKQEATIIFFDPPPFYEFIEPIE